MRRYLPCLVLILLLAIAGGRPAAAGSGADRPLRLVYIGAINGYLQLCG
ncbi:MAG: hypothetical protein JRJ56_01265 [Deltaproteobacteria bacterium]|nr:hypothetical protein [Deltaproteobacteria bacterium]